MNVNRNFKMVSSAKLHLEGADWQRPINHARVKRIAKNWDTSMMRTIMVADINGVLYPWDGQHTVAAAVLANGGKDLELPCIVDKMTHEEAAKHVADQYKNVKRLSAIEMFNARVSQNDADALNIKRVLAQHNVRLSPKGGLNSTAGITAIEKIYKKDSCLGLDYVIGMAKKAWPDDAGRYRAEVLLAIEEFDAKFKGKYTISEFKRKVGSKPVSTYTYAAKDNSGNMVKNLVVLFTNAYNNKRRSNVLDIRLALVDGAIEQFVGVNQ